MVKKITKYESFDGSLFDNRDDAKMYEGLTHYYNRLICEHIPEGESGKDISDSDIKEIQRVFWDNIIDHAPQLIPYIDKPIFGRVLSDISESSPFHKILNRFYYTFFMCVGDDGKIYSQPYYANLTKK